MPKTNTILYQFLKNLSEGYGLKNISDPLSYLLTLSSDKIQMVLNTKHSAAQLLYAFDIKNLYDFCLDCLNLCLAYI